MKPLILLVDDNQDLLFSMKIMLEINDYAVITANDGLEALKILSELENIPEIIISDIMMPIMDGYDFFKSISESPKWNQIPFIFLTARDSIEDIRFGKMFGVDDYLTKPFKEKDLLAIITGKITRKKKTESINKKIENALIKLNIDLIPAISKADKKEIYLLFVMWDDYAGPTLKKKYPEKEKFSITFNELSQQLFQVLVSIYGNEDISKAEGVLINIDNIKRQGFLFFDSYPDKAVRAGESQYMLAIIAPKITYFESFKIKEILFEISSKIKENKDWDIKYYWNKIQEQDWDLF